MEGNAWIDPQRDLLKVKIARPLSFSYFFSSSNIYLALLIISKRCKLGGGAVLRNHDWNGP